MCRNKLPSKWQKNCVTTNFLGRNTKILILTSELCRNIKQRVETANGKNRTSQMRQKQFMLRHNDEHKAEVCHNKTIFYRDTDYCNMEKPVETEEKLRKKFLSRKEYVCREMERISLWS